MALEKVSVDVRVLGRVAGESSGGEGWGGAARTTSGRGTDVAGGAASMQKAPKL